jgi:transposase
MSIKIRIPHRDQIEMRCESLDEMLTPDHEARAIWEFVCQLDLTPWTAKIKSAQGCAGTKALDPRVLLSLWILATLDGIGSARELSRLTAVHMAYRWLCGDEPVNYHSLADFRTSEPEALEALLVQSAAALMYAGAADLKRVAQDGVRVRANAGASSYRREKTLRRCLEEAEAQLAALKDEGEADGDEAPSQRQQAARERAARERKAHLEDALSGLKELQEENAKRPPCRRKDPEELRASTTDPDAPKMKMADGGFRPAYNVQFATTVEGGAIVAAAVTDEGVDSSQMEPMLEKIEALYGERPEAHLVDGGYVDQEAIDRAEQSGIDVYAPVPCAERWQAQGKDPFARRPEDSDGVAEWRERMGTEPGREAYKKRASTAEWANAQARNHGLRQFMVRGMKKVLSSVLMYALAHNFERQRAWKLAAAGA